MIALVKVTTTTPEGSPWPGEEEDQTEEVLKAALQVPATSLSS